MNATLPVWFVGLFSLFSLLNFIVGYYMAGRSFKAVQLERHDLREDRRMLAEENKQLREEVFTLKGQVLELQQRINGYEDMVNRLSQKLSEIRQHEEGIIN